MRTDDCEITSETKPMTADEVIDFGIDIRKREDVENKKDKLLAQAATDFIKIAGVIMKMMKLMQEVPWDKMPPDWVQRFQQAAADLEAATSASELMKS